LVLVVAGFAAAVDFAAGASVFAAGASVFAAGASGFGESFGESASAIPETRNSDRASDASFFIASLFFRQNF
jgi:hypothetical protein